MKPTINPAVQTALRNAPAIALSHGAAEVASVHVLGGLLKETAGRAATVLASAGLDLAKVSDLVKMPGEASAIPNEQASMPLSPAVRSALDKAGELAKELTDDHAVTSDLFAYVLLSQDEALRADLDRWGLDFAHLEAIMRSGQKLPIPLDEPLHLADVPQQVDTRRVLDAGANRAREALRVLEDYCRFVLDDAFLSRELKNLRHELTVTLTDIPAGELLEARETLHDVGIGHSTTSEQQRYSLVEVAQANVKRLQEALRSLEEFGKLQGSGLGQTLKQLRYRCYTLEKAIIGGTTARRRLADCRLYVMLTGAQCSAALDWTIAEAAAGGAQIFQLREKNLPDRQLIERARKVRQWTKQAGVLFIMNDRPDIARLVEADGVHLGQEDMSVKDARRLIGADALVGVSTHNMEQVRQAVLDGASYLGIGPTFASQTKTFTELSGLEFVELALAETSLPAFALGGVTLDNLPAVLAAGAGRVAVSQAICRADDPRSMAAQFRRLLDAAGA